MKRFIVAFLILPFPACAPPQQPVDIRFAAAYDRHPISCTREAGGVLLNDLRFYVYDVTLIGTDGREMPLELTPDGSWQSGKVALIDLETGEGACLNGTAATHEQLSGTYPGGGIAGIRFSVGVPESLNHEDPLAAAAPLNYSVMHWHWASGYKFLRAGIESGGDSVFLHLGSARCEGTIGDIRGCRSSNRPVVSLPGFDPATDVVVLDLGVLFGGTDLGDGERSECMSGPASEECVGPFRQLGIDSRTGETIEPAPAFAVHADR